MTKKTLSTPKLALISVLALAAGFGTYRFTALRSDAEGKVRSIEAEISRERGEILALYRERVEMLETWEAAVRKGARGEMPANLKLSETVRTAKSLKLESEADVAHFDFVQNQVSQAIGEYLQSETAAKHRPKGLEKLEESINFRRRSYHVAAFRMESLQSKYRLKSARPLVFPGERILKDRGLFR